MHKVNPDLEFEQLSKHLFWEYDRSKLSFEKNAPLVIHRVLEYGMLEDWKIIQKKYGIPKIAEIAKGFRSLEPMAATFIASLSNQPIETFRCYSIKQSKIQHWIS
jgi:hypothetical protein